MRHTQLSAGLGSKRWSPARAEIVWTEQRPELRGQMVSQRPFRHRDKEEQEELTSEGRGLMELPLLSHRCRRQRRHRSRLDLR